MKKMILYSIMLIQTITSCASGELATPSQCNQTRLSVQEIHELTTLAMRCRSTSKHGWIHLQDNGQNPVRVEIMPTQLYQQKKLLNHQKEEEIQTKQELYQQKLKLAEQKNNALKLYAKLLILTSVVSTWYACYLNYSLQAK